MDTVSKEIIGMSNEQLTIIVPIYNESENIQRLKDALSQYFQKASVAVKALFVNDGSSDGSLEKLKSICKNSHCFD
ncbi:MAG: glycosyltransferase, partial [Bacteroidetes bacterium]|nr:glycosyltransferase [Bacteroidota bacterium]